MSTKFNEVIAETAAKAKTSKSGKVKKTHSKSEFDKCFKAYINDVDYTTKVVDVKGGEPIEKEISPVKMMRESMLKKPLMDAGVDSQEAKDIAENYQFSKVDGMYEVMTDFMYQYLTEGKKKLDFPTRKDFTGSISIDKVEKNRKTYRAIANGGESFDVETDEHYILKSKSKSPAWLKKKFK